MALACACVSVILVARYSLSNTLETRAVPCRLPPSSTLMMMTTMTMILSNRKSEARNSRSGCCGGLSHRRENIYTERERLWATETERHCGNISLYVYRQVVFI